MEIISPCVYKFKYKFDVVIDAYKQKSTCMVTLELLQPYIDGSLRKS